MVMASKQFDATAFSLSLVDSTTEWIPPPTLSEDRAKIYPPYVSEVEKQKNLLSAIDTSAKTGGLTIKSEVSREETETSRSHNEDFYSTHEPKILYHGGAPGHEFINTEIITYFCGSVAAFAVFIRNALGAAKDWRDLRAGRKVVVRYAGKELKIREGADLEEFIGKIEKGPAPESSPRRKTKRRPR